MSIPSPSVEAAGGASQFVRLPAELHETRYDLNEHEIAVLTDALFDAYAPFILRLQTAGARFGCVALDGHDPLSNIGRLLEQQVFDEEAGDHSVEFMEAEYGPYEDRSVFFLAVDAQEQQVVGAARGITGSVGFGPTVKTVHDSLKTPAYRALDSSEIIDLRTGDDDPVIDLRSREASLLGGGWLPHDGILTRRLIENYHDMRPGEHVIDGATMVVPKHVREFAQLEVSVLLYAASIRATHLLGIPHVVMFVRSDLLALFRELFKMGWENLAGLNEIQYVDGDPFMSQPVYASVGTLRTPLIAARHRLDLGHQLPEGPHYERLVRYLTGTAEESLFSFFRI